MDSPTRSERIETRFSTPVSDLDDHRHPPPTSPIAVTSPAISAGLGVPIVEDARPGPSPNEYRMGSAPVARDFENENAIMEEDSNASDTEGFQGVLEGMDGPVPKRGFSRHVQQKIEEMGRARDRSPSDRSLSPPNSIDAFAEPRRRERANTFGSKAPSDLELQRTVSGGTHTRRPTFSSHSNCPGTADVEFAPRGEPDAGYDLDEARRTSRIDYEALEEFVADNQRARPARGPLKRYSFSSQGGQPYQSPSSNGHLPEVIVKEESNVSGDLLGGQVIDEKPKLDERFFGQRASVAEANRFSFFSSEIEQTIHAPELGDLVMPDESFRDLFELPSENGAWWLDVMNPTLDEMEMFQRAFGVHPLTKEDILERETREKVELFNSYYFVNFRSFESDKASDDYLEPVNVYMIVFREGTLTFTYSSTPHAADVRKKIGKLRNYESLTADWICYAMVDNIVDFFFPVIREIEIETDQIEDQVFVARAEDFATLLRQIGECRKKVMSLMRLLGGKADVIKGFAKRCNAQYSVTPRGDIGLYLSDIQDHVVTMMSNLGHFEKMLSRSHSNYLAQLSVDNLVQGNRANEVLSKITLIATVLVPMNLVCGLFGMNVPVPGGVNDGSLAWFGGIIGFLCFIVLTSLILAKRFKYI